MNGSALLLVHDAVLRHDVEQLREVLHVGVGGCAVQRRDLRSKIKFVMTLRLMVTVFTVDGARYHPCTKIYMFF